MNKNPYEIRNIAEIVKEIRTNCPKDVEKIISWANETANGIICHRAHYEMERCTIPVSFCPSSWNNVPKEIANGDPEWLYAFNRHSILLNLAKAYAFTKNEVYKNTFTSMMNSFLDNTGYKNECLNSSWRSLETGIRVENWLRSLAIFHALGSPLEKGLEERMMKSLQEHNRQLVETHRAFHRLSNWGIIQDHGLFLSAICLGDHKIAETALDRLEEEMVHQVLPDGVDWEQSPLYHCEVLHSALDTMLVAKRENITLSQVFLKKTLRMSEALALLMKKDGLLLLTGDSDEIECTDLIYLASRLFSSPLLSGLKITEKEENFWDAADDLEKTEVKGYSSVQDLEPSGNFRLVTEEMDVRLLAGNLGSGHGHLNPLHMDFTFKGKTFLTDSGRYTYTDCKERTALKDFEAHNTFILEGAPHCKASGSWSYTGIYEMLRTPTAYENGYGLIQASHLEYLDLKAVCRRKILSLGACTILILDEVLSPSEEDFSYKSFWHVFPSCNIGMGRRHASIEKDGIGITMVFDDEVEAEIEKSQMSLQYNILSDSRYITGRKKIKGYETVATLVSGDPDADFNRIAAILIDSKRTLDETEAAALHVKAENKDWTIISKPREIVNQVDIIKAGDLEGYARVIVKERGEKYPTGLYY